MQLRFPDNYVVGIKEILQNKGYPKDNDFLNRFKEHRFYGAGDRQIKTKLVLETLENKHAHKEAVIFDNLTIEHVMPQTLSEWWQNHLGEECEETHSILLHTIGNLTLTAYNAELSNDDFPTKQQTLNESHLELNKYFISVSSWTKKEIEERSEKLAREAIEYWSYFGNGSQVPSGIKDVTGTTPIELTILGQMFKVHSWRDVLEKTLNTIAELEPDKFELISINFPSYLGKEKSKFRENRQLINEYFIETNLSALSIKRFCDQAIELIDLSSEEWVVTTA